jgi:hypothetical protein
MHLCNLHVFMYNMYCLNGVTKESHVKTAGYVYTGPKAYTDQFCCIFSTLFYIRSSNYSEGTQRVACNYHLDIG